MANIQQLDVTGKVDLTRPQEVAEAVDRILGARYGSNWHASVVSQAFADTAAAYAGRYGGVLPCDTPYHDLRHALDVALGTARLIDGWEEEHAGGKLALGSTLAATGVILALLHDVGFLRRADEDVRHGAMLTEAHEERSAEFAARYLAHTRLAAFAPLARLIDATRLGSSPEECAGPDPRRLALGRMVATADLMSQLADRCYLEKCRDFLYEEFFHAGLARGKDGSNSQAPYLSPEDLLGKTTGFWKRLVAVRLDRELDGVYRYFGRHFGGIDPYGLAIERNMAFLGELIVSGDFSRLRRRPAPVFDAGWTDYASTAALTGR